MGWQRIHPTAVLRKIAGLLPDKEAYEVGALTPVANATAEVLPAFIVSTVAREIERYLRTGEADPYMAAWPGTWSEKAQWSRHDLRAALVQEVHRIGSGRSRQQAPLHDSVALVRRKVRPMVDGFFPPSERDAVMAVLNHAVVFVRSENIDRLLLEQRWDRTAWNLANVHLDSIGAELLDPDAERLVGLSEETSCFVSPVYFERQHAFADFLVHEVAHSSTTASVGARG